MELDRIDKQIINLLQKDCKQTTKQLSLQLNLSVTAIYERIKKLERIHIIKKYVALINKNKVHKSLLVFCHIRLTQHTKENIAIFEQEIKKLKEVSECFHVSGDYDYILKVYSRNMEAYREFMVNKITSLQNIGSTHSIFIINEVKNTTSINI